MGSIIIKARRAGWSNVKKCENCGGYQNITKEFMKSGLFAGCACGKPNKPMEKDEK
jgi:hypothetical protein